MVKRGGRRVAEEEEEEEEGACTKLARFYTQCPPLHVRVRRVHFNFFAASSALR